MSAKEDILIEIESYSMTLGIEEEKRTALIARLTMLFKEYNIVKETTELAIRETDEDLLMVKKFLMAKKIKGCTEKTLYMYRTELRRALLDIKKPLKEITVDDIRWYAANKELNCGWERVTCQNSLRTMSTLFTFLSNEGYIQGNPVMKFGVYKVPKKKKHAFTEYEIETMRENIDHPKVKAVFEVLLSTGCRVSELCQIKKSEISGDAILIHGKGQKDRMVYLNTKAIKAVEGYLKWKNQESATSPWLFPKREFKYRCTTPGEHIDKSSVELMLRKLGQETGIKAHPHKFRRTCATLALRRGMDLIYVSKMLGHENVQTTQIYLDIDENALEEQHKRYVI